MMAVTLIFSLAVLGNGNWWMRDLEVLSQGKINFLPDLNRRHVFVQGLGFYCGGVPVAYHVDFFPAA